jgi:acyl carrier protein
LTRAPFRRAAHKVTATKIYNLTIRNNYVLLKLKLPDYGNGPCFAAAFASMCITVSDRREQACRAYARRFASALECFVLDNPYRFFNFYDLRESRSSMDTRTVLKQELIKELRLEDIDPEDIDDAAPLFGESLGLDSLDAVELAVLVQHRFGVIVEDIDAAREAFASVDALAGYIETRRGGGAL